MSTMENFSHPVKAEKIEIHYDTNVGQATIHKAGCTHRAKGWTDKRAVNDMTGPEFMDYVGQDDWFKVAPCAR